ncbi:beta-ketoacyl-[acyl-carrier-protein] synthase family protein [Phenylobacterium sp.]|uniref:beta-ketoacyl-[acyl-carrier-protein] synthase family protein n=1 Tax=Phenylobacterium sp. TaxID=1871053 RepID=UPI002DE6C0B5|nr:beta-ketoacyl-[acyl-carrier-protein] synthase family protein [Phenylobacterium sp.]
MARRIAITGLGAVSAIGLGAKANWDAAREGRSGIAPHRFEGGQHAPEPVTLPAALTADGFAAGLEARFGRKVSGTLDRFALLGLAAAYEAIEQAGLVDHAALDQRTAIVLGHGQGGQETLEKSYERFFGLKSQRMHPATVPKIMVSGGVSAVAMQFGVHGPTFATSSACASSAHAIVQGAGLIQTGLADVAIVGGSEAIATPGCMAGWMAIQALADATCRPFSKDRDGMVMADGGAALILEDYEHARARGAEILAEYLGAGMTSDAFHITQPSLEGTSGAMRQAIANGGLAEADEVLISAHGTGTPLNDKNEAASIRAVFGERARRHPVIATKSAHGHLIGGSAALQAVIALQALKAGLAPPVLNFNEPDPECDVDVVVGQARPIKARHALVNAFAFGGLNVSMAFSA